MTLASAR